MKIFRLTFLLLFLLTTHPAANAQDYVPTPVEISSDLITIDGKTYYKHLVQEKQTLYSICKAYGAEIGEVTNLNLSRVASGLKAGSVLFIPYKEADSGAATSKTGSSEKETVVEKGGQAAAEPVGKDVEQSASQNASQNPEGSSQESSGDTQYIQHRVKWYDSLLMLSLKYKVSQEEIIALNNLDSKTLVVGQYLKIPVGGNYVSDSDNNIIETAEEDPFGEENAVADNVSIIAAGQEEEPEEEPETQFLIPFSGTARVALILPIAASSNSPANNFLDFYAGILMALNEIKSAGINVNLKVIDMADFESFDELADASKLDAFDFIIGHFSTDNVDIAADFCDRHRIPLFSPMDQKIERATYRHPYLVDVPLSAATQAMRLVESIRYDSSFDNVIVLCENTEEPGQFHKDIISSLEYLHIPYSTARGGISRGGSANVSGLLDSGRHNHIIITSEKESIASDAVRNIGLLARGGKNITGYMSGKVRRFESIDQESFQSLNAHFSLGYFVDYKDESVRDFVRQYRALYNSDPTPYSFQGYDIALYGVNALAKYGSFMINGISTYPYSGLQLNFRFDRRTPGGGMFNEGARNIIYENGGITLTR